MILFNKPGACGPLLASLLLACLCLALPAAARDYRKVVITGIGDGNNFTAQTAEGQAIRVRLFAIDAPETKQDHGPESAKQLAALLQGKTPDLDCLKIDRYRRNLCRALVDGRDVGLAMIEAGAAWHFRQFAAEQSAEERRRYEAAEQAARGAKRGLWAKPGAEAPWDWRARQPRKPFDSLINPY